MITIISYKTTEWTLSIYLPYLIIVTLISVHILYLIIGKWILTNSNESYANSIFSLMNVSATTFAAITAAILVTNWKIQHNKSATSKLITEIWNYHHQLEYEINNLAYTYNEDSGMDEIINSYKNTIQYAHELRTKTKHVMILFKNQYDLDAIEILQDYLYYLDNFHPGHQFDFFEFQKLSYKSIKSYKEINKVINPIFEQYLYLE